MNFREVRQYLLMPVALVLSHLADLVLGPDECPHCGARLNSQTEVSDV